MGENLNRAFARKPGLTSILDSRDFRGLQAHRAQQERGDVIPKTHDRRVIVVVAATVGAAAIPGRLGLCGARLLETGLFLSRLFLPGLLLPGLLGADLASGARGAGGAILTGGAGLAHFTRLLVGRLLGHRFGAGEALGAGG